MVWYFDRKKRTTFHIHTLKSIDRDYDEVTYFHDATKVTKVVSARNIYGDRPTFDDSNTYNYDFDETHEYGSITFAYGTWIEKTFALHSPIIKEKEVYAFTAMLPSWPYCQSIRREDRGVPPTMWSEGVFDCFSGIDYDVRVIIDNRVLEGALDEDGWAICDDVSFQIDTGTIARIEVFEKSTTFPSSNGFRFSKKTHHSKMAMFSPQSRIS